MKVIHNLLNIFLLYLHIFAFLTLCRWLLDLYVGHLLLQVTQTEQTNVGEPLEEDVIKETKSEKENTINVYVCNICENSFMYEEGLIDHVLNIHNDWTICNFQFSDDKSLN